MKRKTNSVCSMARQETWETYLTRNEMRSALLTQNSDRLTLLTASPDNKPRSYSNTNATSNL